MYLSTSGTSFFKFTKEMALLHKYSKKSEDNAEWRWKTDWKPDFTAVSETPAVGWAYMEHRTSSERCTLIIIILEKRLDEDPS